MWLKLTKRILQKEVRVVRTGVRKTAIFRWLEKKRDPLEDELDEQTTEATTELEERRPRSWENTVKEGPTMSNTLSLVLATSHTQWHLFKCIKPKICFLTHASHVSSVQ